jgi:tetratricopeptide (TPR) repeat protein
MILWGQGQDAQNESITHFMAAVKLNPFSSVGFAYLGLFYDQCAKQNGVARTCYEKSIKLDSSNGEAGPALYALLLRTNERSAAFQLCVLITSTAAAKDCKWALIRLGHEHLRLHQYNEAVLCGQSVTRVDESNALGWELLGDAYAGRGAYVAALNAFEKAKSLNDDFVYCAFRIGTIEHVLGYHDKAIASFTPILEKHPRYVPALQGVGEVRLSMARRQLQESLTHAAAKNIVLGIEKVVLALQITNQFQCVWKLLGDLCNASHRVPPAIMAMQRLPEDVHGFLKTENMFNETDSVLRLGGFAFTTAIKYLEPLARGPLLGDLSLNFYFRSERFRGIDSKTEIALLNEAITFAKRAVTLCSKNAVSWNVLGVIALRLKARLLLFLHCLLNALAELFAGPAFFHSQCAARCRVLPALGELGRPVSDD